MREKKGRRLGEWEANMISLLILMKVSFGVLGIPPELGHYGSIASPLFFPIDRQL